MAPALAGLINLIPAAINTLGSLVKNKKNKNEATSSILPAFVKDDYNIADGLELSSKAVVGFGIGSYIIYYALSHEPVNLWILGIGALVVIGTSIAKALEKSKGV